MSVLSRILCGALVAATTVGAAYGVAGAEPTTGQQQLDDARRATSRFHDFDAAAAGGYGPIAGPLAGCIAQALDGDPASPAMGVHRLNAALLDTSLDPGNPEVLVYEPRRDGRMRLVGLEFVVFAEAWHAEHGDDVVPRLFGRDLTLVEEPNRYQLPAFYQVHAWVWRHNPDGMFADHNPAVTCAAVTE